MEKSRIGKNVGIAIVRIVCAVVFASFTFTYLYFYQADVLAATQHVLSGGATHYDRTIGAVLITVGLMLLQWAVYVPSRLHGLSHGLTYFPSALFLGIVTSAGAGGDGQIFWGVSWWLLPVLLLLWIGAMFVAMKMSSYTAASSPLPRSLWVNVSTVCLFCLMVGLMGNSDDVYHYRMKMESCLIDGDTDSAAAVGQKAQRTDRSLTMLRIYTLARRGELGERLFTYPIVGTSTDIVPAVRNTEATCVMLPTDSIYRFLGARPLSTQDAKTYLAVLAKTGKATATVADYRLCASLIDRDLDGFVRLLTHYYKNIDDKLPRHYREALTLYTHLRSNPAIVYHDDVMDTDYDDLQALEKKYTDDKARQLAVFDQYRETYWYYYEYGTQRNGVSRQ